MVCIKKVHVAMAILNVGNCKAPVLVPQELTLAVSHVHWGSEGTVSVDV